jgi:hypothetical protein
MRSRSLALFLVLVLGTLVPVRSSFAQPAASGEVKAHMAAADKAAKAKDWERAATEYRAAYDAGHASAAMLGLANALYEGKHAAEAYEAYDEILRAFGDKMGKPDLTKAEARHTELASQTGSLSVRASEAGAQVSIDDKSVGTSPVPATRVAPGTHKIKVTLAGFAPFEKTENVAAGALVAVDATLARESTKGRLVVKEKEGRPIRVVVDGVDVGAAPWEGDLDPGPHEVQVRSTQMASPAQKIDVQKGKTTALELAATPSIAHLTIKVSEPQAILFLDGKPLAEGGFSGDVPPGDHVLAVQKEGFERHEQKITSGAQANESIDVKLYKPGERGARPNESPKEASGIYGGFGLMGLGLVGGTGNDLETRCTDLGAASCDTPMALGGGAFGYVGYAFNPIGFEGFVAGEFDKYSPTGHFNGASALGQGNPSLSGVARTEEFHFARGGGLVAGRVRISGDTEHVRVSLAVGAGVAIKYAIMIDRTATSADGSLKDVYAPKGASYVSPTVVADLSGQWRITRTSALSLGLMMMLETASLGDTDVRAPGDQNRFMGGANGQAVNINTPTYQIASGAQFFLGPFLGMQFGP